MPTRLVLLAHTAMVLNLLNLLKVFDMMDAL